MHLDGWTFAFQVVNALVLVGILWRLLYRPVREGIARRQAEITRALDEAEAAREAVARLEAERAAGETALAAELERRRAAIATEAEAERTRLLAEIRGEGERLLAEGGERLAAERRAAEEALRTAGADLALRIARRLLAGLDPAAATAAFLPPLEAALTALDPARRAALLADLAHGAPVIVATAHPVTGPDRPAWAARLAAAVGADLRPVFVHEPDLVAGVELRLPGHRVASHWAEQLERMRREIEDGDR